MPLQRQQKAHVFEAIQLAGLDPHDFEWVSNSTQFQGGIEGLRFTRLDGARFDFIYSSNTWFALFQPGDGSPTYSANEGEWQYELMALHRWLDVCKREIEAPDLWAALAQEQEILRHPTAQIEQNTPFTADEIQTIKDEFEQLKVFVREALDTTPDEQREINAKLDYLVAAAERSPGRIDWWNQVVGVVLNLAITQVAQPGVVQSLLLMAAHGLAHLFGGAPPSLGPGPPPI
jgi:hypothetical protein